MDQSQLQIDLELLIERKIAARNKALQKDNTNSNLIKYYDAEINLLEAIENYYELQRLTFSKILLSEKMKAYEKGKQSGILQERTGRTIDMS
jgi:hypothetical protein